MLKRSPLAFLGAMLALLAGIGVASTAIELDLQGLVDRSELVIEGRVLSRRVLAGAHGRPETEYVVAIDVPYLGGRDALQTFRFPGGTLPESEGGTALLVPGLPDLAPGEDVILFLTCPSPNGWRMPVGLSQGKYRKAADADGRLRVEREHGELDLYDPKTRTLRRAPPSEKADYQQVRAAIERAVAERRAREAKER